MIWEQIKKANDVAENDIGNHGTESENPIAEKGDATTEVANSST